MKKEITFKELISLGYKEKSIKEEIQSNMLTELNLEKMFSMDYLVMKIL